jgi:hypothetical protein
MDDLDSHAALQRLVFGQVDGAHAAAFDQSQDPISCNPLDGG